jgi:pimeloyl-ACP methyl ester carboxylesterase
MSTVLLVHGGWHGGWCWRKVTARLRQAGHEVFAPTLTGLGERVHLLSPEIGLETHVQDVVGVLEYEDLRNVVLVGHSYGGMVIAGAAERAADRVAHLVFLDAFVPIDGTSLWDLLPDSASRERFETLARMQGDGWRIPLPWESALRNWGVTAADDLRWMMPRLTPHPLKTMQDRLPSTQVAARLPCTFIHCSYKPVGDAFGRFAEAARAGGSGWRHHQLDTGHDAMVTMPDELTELLVGVR